MSKANVLEWSIEKISKSIKSKEVSPVEVTQATLDLIDKDETNSFITIMEEDALQNAKQAEKDILKGNYKGPLHGISIGIKDLIHISGYKTTFGSETHKDFVPEIDAEVIRRLKESGAIIVGKLNMHNFAYGTTGDRSYYGPVKNPHNLQKIAGASSSGSGAAVASYQCFGSVGSDTGGSVRMPASMCGIVGMKPTFGRVSKNGSLPLCWTLDHLGPMTRNVIDNALMLNVLSGFDSKDPYSINAIKEDFTEDIDADIKGKKIGIPTNFYFDILDPAVEKIFNICVDNLRHLGAEIIPIEIPGMDDLLIAQQIITVAESFASMEKHLIKHPEMIEEEVRSRVIPGLNIQASEYINMLQVRNKTIDLHNQLFEKIDVIMTPTLATLPTDIEQRDVEINGSKEHVRMFAKLTGPSNTTGAPAISVPGGTSESGLPVGIQFIGNHLDESGLYQIAYALEQTGVYQSELSLPSNMKI